MRAVIIIRLTRFRSGGLLALVAMSIVALLAEAAAARQCTGWEQVSTAGPAPRSGASMVYIPDQEKTLLFGGGSSEGKFGDTWTWNGSEWSNLAVAGPSPRYGANMAYDPIRRNVLLYGGQSSAGRQMDTWEFNGTRWRLLSESGPDITNGESMAFDPGIGRIILFDGRTGRSSRTYVWTGHYWMRIAVDGPSVNPYVLVTDLEQGRVLLLALYYHHVIWQWSGGEWTLIDESEGPGDWYAFAVAYDASRHALTVTGGTHAEAFNDETWEWGDSGWQRLVVDDRLARTSHKMVYDEARQRLVVFGGRDATLDYLGDTVEADADTFLSITEQPRTHEVVPGENSGFSVRALGSGPISYQWRKDGAPLSDNGHFTGTQTDSLRIENVGPEDIGSYDAVVMRDCGQIISDPAMLTLRDLPILEAIGHCPGRVGVRLTGSRPNAMAILIYGGRIGEWMTWIEPCSYVKINVGPPNAHVVGWFRAAEDGTIEASGRAAPSLCGGYLQFYDLWQCLPSNAVPVP